MQARSVYSHVPARLAVVQLKIGITHMNCQNLGHMNASSILILGRSITPGDRLISDGDGGASTPTAKQ